MRLFPRTVLDALTAEPDLPAFEHGSRRVLRGELLAMVRRIAAGLRHAGLGPDSTVALALQLSPEAFAAHLAVFALGSTAVCVRPGWTDRQLTTVLAGRVDAVITDAATATPALRRSADADGRAGLFSLGPLPQAAAQAGDLLATPDDGAQLAVMSTADRLARVNFTSGSSGQPKGCAWTYEAVHPGFDPTHWSPVLTRLIDGFERFLAFGSWSMPVMLTFAGRSLLLGGTVVIGGDDARQVLPYEIERHAITGAVTPVPALHRMLDLLRERPADLSSLRAMVVTGSPATPQLLAAARDQLGPVLWQGYGQSESGMISLLTPDDLAVNAAALTSVGRILPHVEVSVRDPSGAAVPLGEVGQIFVRHDQVMAGYWGEHAAETADVLHDGWLDTRDLGRLDGSGFLHLSGRARDVIMVEASVRYAAPIEQVLATHPDVDQAYVVGVPDKRAGEEIHAFVVPAGPRPPDPEVLADLVRAELGAASVPATFTVIDEVPLLPGGKPDKGALRSTLPAVRPPAG